MFSRSKTDLAGNRAPVRAGLLNRPTMDSKSKTLSTMKKKPDEKTSTVSGMNVRKKLPLGAKSESNANSKPSGSGGALSKFATSSNATIKKDKPKITSIITGRGGLKEKVEANDKKTREYRSKIKEILESIGSSSEEMKTLTDSRDSVKIKYEETLEKYEKEKENLDKVRDIFEKELAVFNELKEKCDALEETKKNEEKMIVDLKEELRTADQRREHLTTRINKLECSEKNNKNSMRNLEKEEREFQVYSHEVFQDIASLHNDVYNLKGFPHVFCRVRPQLESEEKVSSFSFACIDECTLNIGKTDISQTLNSVNSKCKLSRKEFVFDKVFSPRTTTKQIFEEASDFAESAFKGQSTCIIVFGPRKSGKTFTIEGPEGNRQEGLLYLMAGTIFKKLKDTKLMGWNHKFALRCSEIERTEYKDVFYNEINSVNELLDAYFTVKTKRSSHRSPFLIQICIKGTNQNLSQNSSESFNIIEASSEDDYSREMVKKLLGRREITNEESHLSHLVAQKALVILNISIIETAYSKCLDLLRFGHEIMAEKLKPTKKRNLNISCY